MGPSAVSDATCRGSTDVAMGERPPVRMETPKATSAVALGPAPASAGASGAWSTAPTAPAAALRGPSLPRFYCPRNSRFANFVSRPALTIFLATDSMS